MHEPGSMPLESPSYAVLPAGRSEARFRGIGLNCFENEKAKDSTDLRTGIECPNCSVHSTTYYAWSCNISVEMWPKLL